MIHLKATWQSQVLLAVTATLVGGGLFGCSEGPAPEDKKTVALQDEISSLGEAARKAGGDFNKLSPADQEKFLQRVSGNQAAARDMVSKMSGKGGPRGAGN